jgi:predicted small secreted protein
MRLIISLLVAVTLSGCYTASGLVTGAGKDLQAAGGMLAPSESIKLGK